MQHSILFISSRSDIAGGENYLLSVMRHIDRERFHPIVVLPSDGVFRTELEALNVEVVIFEANYGWLEPPQTWYPFLSALPIRVRKLRDFIRERGVRLVHTNSNKITEGALAAKLAGVHHVYMAHLEFLSNQPIYQRFPLDRASFAQLMSELSSRIIAVSDSVAASLCPPLLLEKIQVLHNGLELDKFNVDKLAVDGDIRSELGVPANALLVVAIGRIHPDKGFDYFVEAAGEILPKHENTYFLIAGACDSPDFYEALVNRISSLGLEDRIRFMGLRNDVPRLLAQSDVFVLSSRKEGHPFALLESMACACPAVATRCGGVEETVAQGETGYIVNIGDVPAMASRIRELLEDSDLRRRISLAARKHVIGNFEAGASIHALEKVYEEALALPSPAPGSFSIELFLQGASECGYLGSKVTSMEERLKQVENFSLKLTNNFLYRIARDFIKRIS
jgi:glycosyltransferase involved in cell wall biosynthesis